MSVAAAYEPGQLQTAVRWHPPKYDIRVERVPVPTVEEPDDAIVKISLAGLCGSDLHVYRGHEDVDDVLTCGHEFLGEVVALGSSFSDAAPGRPPLYSELQIGDKVLSPFTVTCGECHSCRIGFTARCVHSRLFGIPSLPGGQAQFVRVPKAGGTLFRLSPSFAPNLSDPSLLLLADILPTGYFAALQALQHPKLQACLDPATRPYPYCAGLPPGVQIPEAAFNSTQILDEDRTLTIAIVGLGPVGICAAVSLLDLLSSSPDHPKFNVVAVDPLSARRAKMQAVYTTIDPGPHAHFQVADIEEGKQVVDALTGGLGCNAVLEIVGQPSALSLAYSLVRPFGHISSVGVHQAPPVPFTGREVYDKNVSFDFGRCPVRAMFPLALALLRKRQDVFGSVGSPESLVERVLGFGDAVDAYEEFDKGRWGKIVFDPWR